MIIDFRVRPPFGSYLNAIMYRDLPRSERFSQKMGMYQPDSVKNKSMELLLQEMEEAGITRAVIPGRKTNPNFGVVDNEDIKNIIKLYPNKFIGMAGIDPLEGEGAIEEIEKYVVNGDFKGIVMEPGVLSSPMYADDKRIYPIYEKCQNEQIPVVLMNGGSAGPDVTYSMPVAIDHIAVDFPKLKIVISHGGWPWVSETIHVAFRRGNIYISPDMYMINTPGMNDYILAANYILRDRFLFGTAYPFIPLKDGVEFFKNCGIIEDRLPDLMYNNAAELLGIKE